MRCQNGCDYLASALEGDDLAFSLVSPQGMGMGDVKLAFLMGAALGTSVAAALVIPSLTSLVPSIVILVRHGRASL